ncbi:GNAT family N-acetyltransferase [Enterococcus sp. HY326]|uniref:GNAT family N-acetyltransferase n=1 Tax=Enterococcus sp. HY326 TaxID=2971265 RepID=UPI00224076B9|nr:GNAT family N-acetyltransferase [Enterococcus sp. HY326]
MRYILETPRLRLREWQPGEESELRNFLADPEVMYAYEHGFSEAEVKNWLQWNRTSYQENQFGLWAMELKASGEIIGECGLTSQQVADKNYLEIGYHLQKKFWGHGYAIEAARACKEYAFEHLTDEVVSIVRDTNLASMNVAIRNGMLVKERFSKDYYGIKMPHFLFSVKKA